MNSLAEAAGLPIGLAPVGVIQIRDDDTLAGGGMQKLTILDEDADVLGASSGVEKHQVAGLGSIWGLPSATVGGYPAVIRGRSVRGRSIARSPSSQRRAAIGRRCGRARHATPDIDPEALSELHWLSRAGCWALRARQDFDIQSVN